MGSSQRPRRPVFSHRGSNHVKSLLLHKFKEMAAEIKQLFVHLSFSEHTLYTYLCFRLLSGVYSRGFWGLAQWLASRTTDQGVPGSRPGRSTVCCGLEQVTFTHCLVLVRHRKPWTDV